MNIIKQNWNFVTSLDTRASTKYIVLHHAAAKSYTAEQVNQGHKNLGYSGIGYHFYVQKDGKVYEGRPHNTVGAHAYGVNQISIGICFEGNFEEETMQALQLNAGKQIIQYVKKLYPNAKVVRHKEVTATACPGRYFPFENLQKPISAETPEEIVNEFVNRGIISSRDMWINNLKNDKADKYLYDFAKKTIKYMIEKGV